MTRTISYIFQFKLFTCEINDKTTFRDVIEKDILKQFALTISLKNTRHDNAFLAEWRDAKRKHHISAVVILDKLPSMRVFDNGGMTADRYFVNIRSADNQWDMFDMSNDASAPNGVNTWAGTRSTLIAEIELRAEYKACEIGDLSESTQRAILFRIAESYDTQE